MTLDKVKFFLISSDQPFFLSNHAARRQRSAPNVLDQSRLRLSQTLQPFRARYCSYFGFDACQTRSVTAHETGARRKGGLRVVSRARADPRESASSNSGCNVYQILCKAGSKRSRLKVKPTTRSSFEGMSKGAVSLPGCVIPTV